MRGFTALNSMRVPLFITTALFSTAAPLTTAEQELIFSAGKGLGDALIQRESIAGAKMLGINYAWRFAEFPLATGIWQWWVQGSYSHLRMDHRGQALDQNIFELKPVLRWYPGIASHGLFVEAGIGAAYLTQKNFGDVTLTTKPNFALHFVSGYRIANGNTVSLRYSHFSNAYTNTPNPGFDFASLNWHLGF
ncbi:acyloxyacyl hydrolase [Microbulbifer sp. TYP-18]|uniref:acyloxyacyl hydrolase n=1 Tax=Microbulbifer sp. TYP-18 TaxID=3230024 RepID=UPI0034C66219